MGIRSADQLYLLEIPPGARELPLSSADPDKLLFDITVSTLTTWLKQLGKLTRLKLPVTAYMFRRGVGEAFNISGTRVNPIQPRPTSTVWYLARLRLHRAHHR
jgi:hypothetical protein